MNAQKRNCLKKIAPWCTTEPEGRVGGGCRIVQQVFELRALVIDGAENAVGRRGHQSLNSV